MLVAAKRGLACPCAVVDAGAKQPILVRQVQPPIFDAGRADRGPRDDLGAVVEITDASSGEELAADTRPVQQDFRTEAEGLLARPLGELRSADALREAEIILDLRARACLAADSEAFDHGRLQPFGGGIDGGA